MLPSLYSRLLLSELRLMPYKPGSRELSTDDMVYASTLNENLLSLGYTLTPADLMRLVQSPERDSFYQTVKDSIGDIKARPMFPNFPSQVMEMHEALLRFHQLVHYFSTYGLEQLLNVCVVKGWLPFDTAAEKTKADTRLLNTKVIELIDEADVHCAVFKRILSKRERIIGNERRLLLFALAKENSDRLIDGVTVRFKENLLDVFCTIFDSEFASEEKLKLLHGICQHTGDVFRCLNFVLIQNLYHLKTSQKRLIVKLLESYPAADLRANLILSNKKAEDCIKLLSFIDYNVYSRSEEHKCAVADLRDGKLRSWHSRVEKMLCDKDDSALSFIASHPGMMVRMCAQLIRLGYDPKEIEALLIKRADSLSAETLITVLTKFGKMLNLKGNIVSVFKRRPNAAEKLDQLDDFYDYYGSYAGFKPHKIEVTVKHDPKEVQAVYSILENVLFEKLKTLDTPIKDKCISVSMDEYALDASVILFNNRSAEGSYVRSGIAYRIPENVRRLRLATYWNDPTRVDIDLHVSATSLDGRNIRIGWNSSYANTGIIFSGDITHSDAAEYIDIDMSAPISYVTANVHLYRGADSFKDIETCFVGMMAVDQIDEDIQLSNPANYFFSHFLTSKFDRMRYGYVDVVNRALIFDGSGITDKAGNYYKPADMVRSRFSMARYLELLIKAQNVQLTEKAEDAELSLVMGKPMSEKEISLLDSNFLLTK